MPDKHPDPNAWWFHRRCMAYWAMAALTLALALSLTGFVREGAEPLVEGICWVFGLVVFAYYGNNAAADIANKRSQAVAQHTRN